MRKRRGRLSGICGGHSMYNDIDELKKEIKAFREKIANSDELVETIRRNDAEIALLRQELAEQKLYYEAEIERLTKELAAQKRANGAESARLKKALDEQKKTNDDESASMKKVLATQKQEIAKLNSGLSAHEGRIRKEAHPWRHKS